MQKHREDRHKQTFKHTGASTKREIQRYININEEIQRNILETKGTYIDRETHTKRSGERNRTTYINPET